MRTSLNEIKQIEDWLLQRGDLPERLVTEAKILSQPGLADRAKWQSLTYEVIQLYGREKLKNEIREVENKLFHAPKYGSFRASIRAIFKR